MNDLESLLFTQNRVTTTDLRAAGYSAARAHLEKQANLSEEIASYARQKHLNEDQIARVVETANQAVFGSMFKTAESKQIEFPVADARIVKELLRRDEVTKTASVLGAVLDAVSTLPKSDRDLESLFGLTKAAHFDIESERRQTGRETLALMDLVDEMRVGLAGATEKAKTASMELRKRARQCIDLSEATPADIAEAITGLARNQALAKTALKSVLGEDTPVVKTARLINEDHPLAGAYRQYEDAVVDVVAREALLRETMQEQRTHAELARNTDRLLGIAQEVQTIAKEAGLISKITQPIMDRLEAAAHGGAKAAVNERLDRAALKVKGAVTHPATMASLGVGTGIAVTKGPSKSAPTPTGQPKLAAAAPGGPSWLQRAGVALKLLKEAPVEQVDNAYYNQAARKGLQDEAAERAAAAGKRLQWSQSDIAAEAERARSVIPGHKDLSERAKALMDLDPAGKSTKMNYEATQFGKGAGRAAGAVAVGGPAILGIHALANMGDKVDAGAKKGKAWKQFSADYPDLASKPQVRQQFETLWNVAPNVAADPAIAGPWLRNNADYASAGMNMKSVKDAADLQKAIGDARASQGYAGGSIRAQLSRSLAAI